MIGEVDIFYALQTQLSDWFPTKATLPPPPEYDEKPEDLPIQGVQPKPNQQPDSQLDSQPTPQTKPPMKNPNDIIQDGEDNNGDQKRPGEIFVTGPPKRIDTYFDDVMFRKQPPGLSFKQPYFWKQHSPVIF